jgi:hypothetical protein
MSAIKQRIQAFPLAHHRPPDCWGEYFSRFAEPICTRTRPVNKFAPASLSSACSLITRPSSFPGRRLVRLQRTARSAPFKFRLPPCSTRGQPLKGFIRLIRYPCTDASLHVAGGRPLDALQSRSDWTPGLPANSPCPPTEYSYEMPVPWQGSRLLRVYTDITITRNCRNRCRPLLNPDGESHR